MMSPLVNKRYCVWCFLFLLSTLECGVFGGVTSAELDSEAYSLLRKGAAENSENFVSRKRKSVDGEEGGMNDRGLSDDEDDGDYSSDPTSMSEEETASSNVFNNYEKDTEPPQEVKAQVMSNNSSTPSPAPTNSIIASSAPSVTQGGTAPVTQVNGSSEVSRNLTSSATVPPTQPSSSDGTGVPGSSTTADTTASDALNATIAVSTQQSKLSTDTQNATSSEVVQLVTTRITASAIETTTKGDDDGSGSPHEKKPKTLFGFVTVEILIALLAGAACAVILVAFLVYRLKKRNEGSYELCETVNYTEKNYGGKDVCSEKEVFV